MSISSCSTLYRSVHGQQNFNNRELLLKLLRRFILFGRVLAFVRYIEVHFSLGFWIVLVITRISLYRGSVPYKYCNFGQAEEYRSLYRGLRYTLYRGSLNRGSTVFQAGGI